MVKKLVIIGLLLLMGAAPCLYWSTLQRQEQQQLTEHYKAKYKNQLDEYFKKFSSQKPDPSKPVDPMVFSAMLNNGKNSVEIHRFQENRLFADIEDLSDGTIIPPSDADLVYGKNWRLRVDEYRSGRQKQDAFYVVSMAGAIIGGGLAAVTLLILLVRGFVRILKWLFRKTNITTSNKPERLWTKMAESAQSQNIEVQLSRPSGETDEFQNYNPVQPTTTRAIWEEFEKLLSIQKQSYGEAVTELKQAVNVLQYLCNEQAEKSLSKQIDKISKSQGDRHKEEMQALKKIIEDVNKGFAEQVGNISENLHRFLMAQTGELKIANNDLKKAVEAACETMKAKPTDLDRLAGQVQSLTKQVESRLVHPSEVDAVAKQIAKILEGFNTSQHVQAEELQKTSAELKQAIATANEVAMRVESSDASIIAERIGQLTKLIEEKSASSSAAETICTKIENLADELSMLKQSKSGELGSICNELKAAIELANDAAAKAEAANTGSLTEKVGRLAQSVDEMAMKQVKPEIISEYIELTKSEVRELVAAQKEEIKEVGRDIKDSIRVANENVINAGSHDLSSLYDKVEILTKTIEEKAPKKFDAAIITKQIEDVLLLHNVNIEKASREVEQLKVLSGDIAKRIETIAANDNGSGEAERKLIESTAAKIESVQEEIRQLTDLSNDITQSLSSIVRERENTDGSEAQIILEESQRTRKVCEAAVEQNHKFGKNLDDLAGQVAAIREYAAQQQQQLVRLQDGYDWNIIKNMCLRVIRCIDNIDVRIADVATAGGSIEHLQTVREELMFILESHGVEAFGAMIGSSYHGQEHRMHVLNEREYTEEASLVGKIAEVVRPGYQFVVNDNYVKIVRAAQVRLYGATSPTNAAVKGE